MDKVMAGLNFYNQISLRPTLGATIDRGPSARQEVRMMGSLWSAYNWGQVTRLIARRGGLVQRFLNQRLGETGASLLAGQHLVDAFAVQVKYLKAPARSIDLLAGGQQPA